MRGRVAVVAAAVLTTGFGAPALAAGPELHVSVLVDRVTARPGDVVHYEVRVENLGSDDAGVVRVTSNYPPHTTAATQRCPEGPVEPDGDVCLAADLPTPGIGDDTHQVNHSQSGLAPGAAFSLRFAVRVDDDAPLGAHLGNHAHASSPTASETSSAPVDTLVVDAIPNAVFGQDGVDLSGHAVTDSWDSSTGTLEQTREARDGDVASNDDIALSGESLVNGDATPGPGRTVAITNTARVTGSTAPAASAVVLNRVDASAYATNNDNHRICRAAGSCEDASFDPVTRTLAVGGSAVLPTGAYFLCRLEVSGALRVAGNVTIWLGPPSVCGDPSTVSLTSSGSVSIDSGRSVDFQLRVDGPGRIRLTSSSTLTGVVYAPLCVLAVEGQGVLLGNASVLEASLGGHALVHIDRALAG